MNRRRKRLHPAVLAGLGILVLAGAAWALMGTLRPGSAASGAVSSAPPAESLSQSAAPQKSPPPAAPSDEWRAVWLSYLEYQRMDFSGESAFSAEAAALCDKLAAAGCNTLLAQVRPCGDALYPSEIFPFSHFVTGTQGQDPGYDPFAILVREAHARGIRIEAWVNPYRVRIGTKTPAVLAEQNPAARYLADPAKAGFVHEVDGGLWYDPGVPEVRELVTAGVAELCQKYEIDGVHFDDYFYPTQDASFDADTYAAYGGGAELAAWRRENVNALIKQVAEAVKASGKEISFGVSPQGNTENNYTQQYSDVAFWMENGWVDYVCPQIYWGFDYRTQSGSDRFAFEVCLSEWTALPRADGVQLYVGLGAYRVGEGDGSSAESAEWQSGENIARQVGALRAAGANGYGIYRYDSLWNETALCQKELAALTAANQE